MQPTSQKPPRLGGLLASRRATVITAVSCGLIAVGILLLAMNGYRNSVNASGQQSTVLVAMHLIQKGTSGNAIAAGQLAVPTTIVQKQVSAGAIADSGTLRGRVASRDILPGQQLTDQDFTAANGIAATLAPNQRAVSVSLDQEHGLLGTVQSGDHVDVYGGFNVDRPDGKPAPIVRLLVPDVQVLQTSSGTGNLGGGGQTGTVTLAVTDTQSAVVSFAADNGKVWLALRPGNAASTPSTFQDLGAELAGWPAIVSAANEQQLQQVTQSSLNQQIQKVIARARG